MKKILSFLTELSQRALRNQLIARSLHTFWQAFLASFLLGVPLVTSALRGHGLNEGERALISLATASAAAGFAAARITLIATVRTWVMRG